MTNFERQALGYTCVCHGLVHVVELTYGTVLVAIAHEFGASLLTLGVLANVFGLALGITALPVGVLADRMGETRLLMLCCLGMGISAVVIGLSPNVRILGAGLLLLGLALGIFHPVGSAFVARVATNRGSGFGYMGVGGNLGLAFGPILSGAIASVLGWRASYFIFALPALVLAFLFFLSSRAEIPVVRQPVARANTDKDTLRPFLVPLLLIICASVMNGLIYRGAVTFLPLYLSERIQLTILNWDSVLIAGSFATVALVFGVVGQFLGGYLSDRRRREGIAFVSALATVPLLLVVGNSEGAVLLCAAAGFAFFHFMGQPVYNALIADYSPSAWRGRLYGVYFFCAMGGGSFAASILGYVGGEFGTNWVFIVAAGFGLLALACIVFLLIRAIRLSARSNLIVG